MEEQKYKALQLRSLQEPCQGERKPHPLQFALANEKLQDQL